MNQRKKEPHYGQVELCVIRDRCLCEPELHLDAEDDHLRICVSDPGGSSDSSSQSIGVDIADARKLYRHLGAWIRKQDNDEKRNQ